MPHCLIASRSYAFIPVLIDNEHCPENSEFGMSTVAITVDKAQEILGYEEPRDLSAEDVQQISAVKAKPKRVTKGTRVAENHASGFVGVKLSATVVR